MIELLAFIFAIAAIVFCVLWIKGIKNAHRLETIKNEEIKNLSIQIEKQKSMEEYAEKFKNISQEILDIQIDKTEKELHNTITPLKENVNNFKDKIEDYMKENSNIKTAMFEKFANLDKSVSTIDNQAKELTEALKGNVKKRGDWGEYILETVLETAGLIKGQNYDLQASYTVEDKRYRPDALIKLPEDKYIIIDAKVSLIHYQNYLDAATPEDEENHKKKYLAGVAKQITETSKYLEIKELNSPSFVIMFIPITSAWELLHQLDPVLIEEANKKSVLILSPSNLLAVLKIIHNFWSSYKQNKNLHEIATLCENIHSAVFRLIQNIDDSLKTSEKLTTNINKIKNSINGPKGVIRYAKKLEEFGIESNKNIPEARNIEKLTTKDEKIGN